MAETQQQQTLEYFRTHADDWRRKAEGIPDRVNVIKLRNDFVLSVAQQRPPGRALDVGCGTGDLAMTLVDRGWGARGIDFSQEMIDTSVRRAAEAGNRATFTCASIVDFDAPPGHFDLISANGFIEYISREQLREFLKRAAAWLAPGGSVVIGSRNRLFNILSLNGYTAAELTAGYLDTLVGEAIAFMQSSDVETALEGPALSLEQAIENHPRTGIDVGTRYQYSPRQLSALARELGYRVRDVYPVHVHGIPASLVPSHPQIHAQVAALLQTIAVSPAKIPAASTFMLHLMRA